MFTKEDCSKNLQIENRSSSCQRWSLHGFQTSHFICDRFGCKFWSKSIQNHARHRFKAFARRHLKSLRCSIRIWADALSSDSARRGRISFATDWAANFACDRFRITPDIVSMLLRAAVWSRCAVWFKFEQMPHRNFNSHIKRKWLVAARYLQISTKH